MSIGLELICSIPRSSLLIAEGRRSNGTCRLVTVPRAQVTSYYHGKFEKLTSEVVLSDVQNIKDTCSPGLSLAIRGLMNTRRSRNMEHARRSGCQMLGKIGWGYLQCRPRLVVRASMDGVEEWNESRMPDVLQSDTDPRADGFEGDGKDSDAGNNGGDDGAGGGGSNGGNNGGDNVGDNKANDGVPWLWWMLCTAASGSNSSSGNEQSGLTAAGFTAGSFDVIGRFIVLASSGPLLELVRGVVGLVYLILYLSSDHFDATLTGMLFGIMGLPIVLAGFVVSWLFWKWRGNPSVGEQQDQDEEEDDDNYNWCSD